MILLKIFLMTFSEIFNLCFYIVKQFLLLSIAYFQLISYVYLLNVEPSNLLFLKTYNTEFDEIIITFPDQNFRSLEIENNDNLALFINK